MSNNIIEMLRLAAETRKDKTLEGNFRLDTYINGRKNIGLSGVFYNQDTLNQYIYDVIRRYAASNYSSSVTVVMETGGKKLYLTKNHDQELTKKPKIIPLFSKRDSKKPEKKGKLEVKLDKLNWSKIEKMVNDFLDL